jgi:dihydroflavonol-4-reductase
LVAERGRVGEAYNIGGGQITMRRIVETWKRTPGGLKPFLWLPKPLALFTGIITEPLLRWLGLPAFISREVVTTSFVTFRHSSAKAERELGFTYRSPEQAWRDTLAGERAKLNR